MRSRFSRVLVAATNAADRQPRRTTRGARRLSAVAIVALTTVLVLLLGTGIACAGTLEDDWAPGSITSMTNPGDLSIRESSWRWNWGNSLDPNLTFSTTPADDRVATTGFLYVVDQIPWTVPSAVFSQPVEFSSEITGPLFVQTFNVPGIVDGRGYTPQPGTTVPGEGQWWMHIRLTNPLRAEMPTGTLNIPIGVDVTPPDPVRNLRVTVDGTNGVNGWIGHGRRVLRWDRDTYDALSGAGAFEIKVNGVVKTQVLCAAPDPAVYWWSAQRGYNFAGPTYMADPDCVTLESLAPGESTIEVTVLDRATNRSTPVSIKTYSDPDVPTVKMTEPSGDGESLGLISKLSAVASDSAGISKVTFTVDGSVVASVTPSTVSSAPVNVKVPVDWTGFANGPHSVSVTAVDMFGRPASSTRSITLDKTSPKPVVTIIQPSIGQALPASAPIRLSATDPSGVTSITCAVDGITVGNYRPATPLTSLTTIIFADLAAFSPGDHVLTVTVLNKAGNTTVKTTDFVLDPNAVLAAEDFGALYAGWEGTTETNPNQPDDLQSFWRLGWGNSLHPQVTVTSPTADALLRPELLYTVNRNPLTNIDFNNPTSYFRSVLSESTHLTGNVDILSVLAADPLNDGRTLFAGRASQAPEGWWYLHMGMASDAGNIGTSHFPIGIDLTPPAKVTGLRAYSAASPLTPLPGWTEFGRAHLRWDAREYDLLSGTAYFRVYVDGKCLIPGAVPLWDPTSGEQGVPWYKGASSGAITLEDLSPGQHTISVSAVDRATNESALATSIKVGVDPDAPKLSWKSPYDGSTIGLNPTFLVDASDQGGVSSVKFYVDGDLKFVDSQYPYAYSPSMSAYASGSHSVKAEVTDMVGRAASSTRSFRLDRTPPKISSISDGPDPFFPRKREGYKDDLIVKFGLSETSRVDMLVYTSGGTFWRKVSPGTRNAGGVTIKWNGRSDANKCASGKFKFKLRATDAAGNTTTTGWRYAEIRFYELKRLSAGSVRIIQR